jgi:hypothetical protein
MAVTDIAWGVGLGAPFFKIGAGWVMLQFTPKNFRVTRRLFLISPLAPLIATFIWAYNEHPSLGEIVIVSAIVGAPMGMLMSWALIWLGRHERQQRAPTDTPE